MVAGLIVIVLVWVRDMLWAPYDRKWLVAMGGYLGGRHTPPAGRFNAGQKLFFWWALLLGLVLAVTGLAMGSGFEWGSENQAQIYTFHDAAALLMILSVLLHVYLSVFVDPESMRGIFGGRVLASWARERHSQWQTENRESSASGETAEGDGKQAKNSKDQGSGMPYRPRG
jgi:formate dehydrogenase subunit gamma